MANIIKIRKVNAVPASPEASTLYLVKSATAGLLDIYVSDAEGTSLRHIISDAEISAKIAQAIAGFNTATVVNDITARNALNPTVTCQVMVLDATGDNTVQSGGATYIFNAATTEWIKISESESMDVVLQWANIQGKPTSTVADIDAAVTQRHTHGNKSTLDGLSEGSDNLLHYKGQPIRAYLEEEAW